MSFSTHIEGTELDPRSIPLYTALRTRINNTQKIDLDPTLRRRTVRNYKRVLTKPHELRSISGRYNCVGLVFASRRTAIDPDQLDLIYKEDGYRSVDGKVIPGDVAVYRSSNTGDVTHVGIVLEVLPNLVDPDDTSYQILSKWGPAGEYVHDASNVLETLGVIAEFWREKD